jgi:hypothetical protein
MIARPEITGRTIVRRKTGATVARAEPPQPEPPQHGDGDAYSIAEFCERHRISVPLYYKLRQQKLTPTEIRLGARVLISRESAAAWRRERELAQRIAGGTG